MFSTSLYLSVNWDVKTASIDPLIHFDQYGWREGRVPSITFDPNAYLAANPDVKAAGIDPLVHFLQNGREEGRQPIAPSVLLAGNGFDYVYYLQHNLMQHNAETLMKWALPGCSPSRTTGWDYTGTTR